MFNVKPVVNLLLFVIETPMVEKGRISVIGVDERVNSFLPNKADCSLETAIYQ